MSDIDIDNLGVTFPDGTAGLSGITLRIPSGEFVALVGPSGSGKTTLLRTIAGFIEPSEGAIALGGEDVSDTPPEKRQMGMVFQQHAVWPHMSVADNVAYPLRRSGVKGSDVKSRVEETLATVGLEGYGDRKPGTLSGGQRQRVALARAIVAHPRVLLLDEALSALDEPLRDSLRREIVSLTRQHDLTTVHVTHDRKEAVAVADRIAVLHDGQLEQFDTPHAVVTRPATAWAASFIADATLLDGTVRGSEIVVNNPSLRWPRSEVTVGGSDGLSDGARVTVAVLPDAVQVGPAFSAGVQATVTSVLFEVTSYSVNLESNGVEFRARMAADPKPAVGDTVRLSVNAPLIYPA